MSVPYLLGWYSIVYAQSVQDDISRDTQCELQVRGGDILPKQVLQSVFQTAQDGMLGIEQCSVNVEYEVLVPLSH